ncbi:putative eukaryotic translation initiation factor [Trypanosoma rangeli]|uniref:Eukaryotic translation initiation factor 3 subunit E n=1 Tax=Trypanosoma rangeli TaxID=5698 RepID=A0A3R7MGF4_TRYRA|nr:putative eukaryotic translation initiation factor [Trypanosoma rangeli]RNF02073.1 putative eukaryotic translation initiation factor [Trypanosoma rangeli]|eukprot:RNF02073.1 putative eukaryotic translation initiation factor [Trypanosoma rangeli]
MTEMLRCMLPHLDKHLALGLLYFYDEQGYDVADALRAVQAKTALTAEGEVSVEQERKIKETARRARLALDEFFEKNDAENGTYQFKLTASEIDALRSNRELSRDVLESKGITRNVMNAVMELAYLHYDAARYTDASELLSLCQCVVGYELDQNTLLWGKLVSDMCTCNWPSAIAVAEKLRRQQNADVFEEDIFRVATTTTTRERAWLLHWVLFPFFKGGNQYSTHLLNFVFDFKTNFVYQSVVETVCPHYLRYICAAAILNKQRRSALRNAAAMVANVYEYSDPITQLVHAIINRQSFEDALALLPEVRSTALGDYFLSLHAQEIVENARRLIFARYMMTHCVVSIPYVADKLGMSTAEAEVWLASLISETKQRAKIDSVAEQMVVGSQVRSVHQTVLDKLEVVDRR